MCAGRCLAQDGFDDLESEKSASVPWRWGGLYAEGFAQTRFNCAHRFRILPGCKRGSAVLRKSLVAAAADVIQTTKVNVAPRHNAKVGGGGEGIFKVFPGQVRLASVAGHHGHAKQRSLALCILRSTCSKAAF